MKSHSPKSTLMSLALSHSASSYRFLASAELDMETTHV